MNALITVIFLKKQDRNVRFLLEIPLNLFLLNNYFIHILSYLLLKEKVYIIFVSIE